MSMKKAILLLLLISTYLISSPDEQEFNLTTLQGETFHLTTKANGLDIKESKGKVTFLAFFGYNCNPCRREIPEFVKMYDTYKKDLEIIAVEVQGTQEEVLKGLVKSKNINYPIVPFKGNGRKFAYYISKKADWKGAIPFIIILDREGEVQFLQTGLVPYALLERAFNKVKGEKPKAEVKESKDVKPEKSVVEKKSVKQEEK